MRILYLTQYYPPEVGATQSRALEMARGLVGAGHDVTVITEVPNHPSGIIRPAYRRRVVFRSREDGIDVIRVWVRPSRSKSFGGRLMFYGTYMAAATLAGTAIARGRFDVIFATSPPLFTGAAALILRFLKRSPMVFEVRDLWPESAVKLGILRNPRTIRIGNWLANRCYRRSLKIVVVTKGIRRALLKLGIPESKTRLIPNGANTDLYRPDPQGGAAVRRRLGLDDAMVMICAGTMSIAYSLDTVLEAAASLRDEPVVFLLIGSGPLEEDVRRIAKEKMLSNVRFLGEIPYTELPAYLSAADASLIPLRRLDWFRGTLPARLFDAFACACPVIACDFDEIAEVVRAAEAGVLVPPEDPQALAEAIRALSSRRGEIREMGRKGRSYVETHYSRKDQAQLLSRVLEEALAGG